MSVKYLIMGLSLVFATAVHSHANVENEIVKVRMKAMSEISDNMRVLGKMMKGIEDFDLEAAQSAIGNIAVLAAQTPEMFKIEAVDPHAEAKPEIWTNFDDFVEKALTLENVALDIGSSLTGEEGLRNAMMSLGATCKACHSLYRN
ncbi:MAG: cytochrome c [Paracoccaceae bacterium]|nr:cytochrome c [Paracoccaceae bacterium]